MRRLLLALVAAVVLFASSAAALAENPIVRHIYTADPAALVVGDRLYLYTGHDEASPSQTDFVMRDWHVFSSTAASDDPAGWTDHGAALSLEDFAWAGANAWAGEVEERNGKYYWYVSVDGQTDDGWMNIGVAVADSPTGPFSDAIGGPLISDSTPNSSALNIDPTVFVDAAGQAYLTWGSYWEPRIVKLKDNMVELDGPVLEPQGLTATAGGESGRFWEAPWMFERGGIYYLAYASNQGADCVTSSRYACIRYATADNPLGPWTERGVVLDQVSSTTNHPAINDGIDPPLSNDALNPRWGTWPERGTQWLELAWERPVRLSGSDLYFFSDIDPDVDGGVKAPAAWSMQYWDGQQFVDVGHPSEYGVQLDSYNRTTFDPVTTTRLRATLQAGTGALGVLEWKTYAVQAERLDPVHQPTTAGTQPGLPGTVRATYADGSQLEAGVWWPPITAEQLAKPATGFAVEGVVEGSLRTVRATVYVCDRLLAGQRSGDLLVRKGWTCLSGVSLNGDVVAMAGTGLVVVDSSIQGAVVAAGGRRVTLAGSEITGPVALLSNRTGTQPMVVSGNTLGGALLCWENAPPPVNEGLPNTARGPVLGQCRGLVA